MKRGKDKTGDLARQLGEAQALDFLRLAPGN